MNAIGEGFVPNDWHIDIATGYVTFFPAHIGFSVRFRPRDFDSYSLSPDDYVAELIHFPAWGEIPSPAELARLSRIAAHLFAIRLLVHLERRAVRDAQHTTEDSPHAETLVPAA